MCPNISIFLALTVLWTSALTGCPQHGMFAPESFALESLECRNDYRSHIRCSWRTDPHVQLSLFHMDPDDHQVSPCVQTPNPSQNPAGQERVYCQYNTSLFAIGFDDVFFFHTPHLSGISKTFRLTKFEDMAPDWNFYQLDDTQPPSPLTSDPFRHHDQERSVKIYHEIIKDKKGGKIHTKPTQNHMADSGNNTEVLSDRPELISDYSLPGPSNLNCVLNDGNNLSCSWDLKTDLAQYIRYMLSYRTHSTAPDEWCCVEKVKVINEGDLLRMVVQPACPSGLSVEMRGEDWILNWTLTKYRTVLLTTELKYWSLLTPEDVKSIFLSDGEMVFDLSERSLKGSSEYRAQVRCNVSTSRRLGWRYTGYPSERLREWDVSLPSPVHSKVSEVSQYPQMDHFPCCTELKDPDISNAQIVDVYPQLSSFDSENSLTPDANNHCQETEDSQVILHVADPCFVSLCSSGIVIGIDSPFQPCTSNFHDPVLPCSEGYMRNPGTTQNTSQEARCLNVEMGDRYMNCPGPDLVSPKRRTNPHSLHRQRDLNTDVFHLPALGKI
ncbi:Cytokine receptor common subunit beta [Labeo rohita]|uniref:Cytokine receptor common subunit beta n=1 Tax=Labeo rohita TaxID=84645 RepID=A0ABQ8LHX3_LABRO|nr:Cytokine receptor common subunit beta [Labeo rohita]